MEGEGGYPMEMLLYAKKINKEAMEVGPARLTTSAAALHESAWSKPIWGYIKLNCDAG